MLLPLDEQTEHWGQTLQKFRITDNKTAELLAGAFQTALRQQSATFASNQLLNDSTNDTLVDEDTGEHGTVFSLTDQARDPGLAYDYARVVFRPLTEADVIPEEDLVPNFQTAANEAVKALFGDAVFLSFAYTPWVMILNRLFTLGFEEGSVDLDLNTKTLSLVTTGSEYHVELSINRAEIENYLDPDLIQATLEGREFDSTQTDSQPE